MNAEVDLGLYVSFVHSRRVKLTLRYERLVTAAHGTSEPRKKFTGQIKL